MTDPTIEALALALLPIVFPDLAQPAPTKPAPMLRAVASRTMRRTAAPYVVVAPERLRLPEA